jgi:hypothetical protein
MRESVQLRGDGREDGAVNGLGRRGGETGETVAAARIPCRVSSPQLFHSAAAGAGRVLTGWPFLQNTDLPGGCFISTERGVYVLEGAEPGHGQPVKRHRLQIENADAAVTFLKHFAACSVLLSTCGRNSP